MKADELVALAAAHGIDLVQAARVGSHKRRPDVRTERFQGGRTAPVLQHPPRMPAHGTATRTDERPEWTIAELGQAAQGVPEIPFLAACYSFAGDASVYWKLWDALHFTALRLRTRNNWAAQVRGVDGHARFYLAEIAQLVLDEDAFPSFFAAAPATEKHASLYAIYLHIDEVVWKRTVFERFDALKLRYLTWLDTAKAIIQPRLRDHIDDEEFERAS